LIQESNFVPIFKGIQRGNRIIQERKWENLVLENPEKGGKR